MKVSQKRILALALALSIIFTGVYTNPMWVDADASAIEETAADANEETSEEVSDIEEAEETEASEETEESQISEEEADSEDVESEDVESDDEESEEDLDTEEAIEEESEAEEAEEAEEEISYPAVSFNQNMSDGTSIHVEAPEGAFPEGTTMMASVVDSELVVEAVNEATDLEVDAEDLLSYDISFFDGKGTKIEPECDINVTISNEELAGGDVEVFHMDDVNSEAEVVGEDLGQVVSSEDGSVEIVSDQFSVYTYFTNVNDFNSTFTGQAKIYTTVSNGTSPTDINGTNYYLVGSKDFTAINDGHFNQYVIRGYELTNVVVKDGNWHSCTLYFQGGKVTAHYTVNSSNKTKDLTKAYFLCKPLTAYTVTLEANGGNCDTSSMTYYQGETYKTLAGESAAFITLPTPTRDHYTFKGWSTDGTEAKIVTDTTPVSGNVTLKAVWQEKSYNTVSFMTDAGTYSSTKCYVDDKYVLPETNPTKNGYVFKGWYTTTGNQVTGDTAFTADSATTLYAHWLTDATGSTITLSQSDYLYSGNPCEPTVTVKLMNGTVVPESGYTVAYSNNVNAGAYTAIATVKFKEPYAGSDISKTFSIMSKNVKETGIKVGLNSNITYDGTDKQLISSHDANPTGGMIYFKADQYDITGQNIIQSGTYVNSSDDVKGNDIGLYKVYYCVKANDKNYYSNENKYYVGDVVIKDGVLSADTITTSVTGANEDDGKVYYDGQKHYLAVSTSTANATITYATTAVSSADVEQSSLEGLTYGGQESQPEMLKPGTYYVAYKISCTGYKDYYGVGTVTINKAVLTAKWSDANQTYTYNAKEQNITVEPSGVIGTDKVSFNMASDSVTKGTDAGTYTAKIDAENPISGADAGNYTFDVSNASHEWKINPAEVSKIYVKGVSDQIYTGEEITFDNIEVQVTAYGQNITLKEGTDYTYTYQNNVNVGNGVINFKCKGNYTGGWYKAFTISKADSCLTAPVVAELTYNGADQALLSTAPSSADAKGKSTGTVMYSLTNSTDDWSASIPTGKDVKTYTVYYKVAGDSNHNDSDVKSINATIAPKAVTVTWSDTKSFVYDYENHSISAIVNDACGQDSVNVIYAEGSKEATAQTELGTYTTIVTGLDNSNYVLANDSQRSATWTITARDLSENASISSIAAKTYTGSALTAEDLVITDTLNGVEHTLVEGTDYTLSYENNTNAGTATVTANFKGNYSGSKSATFTINKAAGKLEIKKSEGTLVDGVLNLIYGSSTGIYDVVTNDSNGKLSPSISEGDADKISVAISPLEDKVTLTPKTQDGEVTVTLKSVGGDNYTDATCTIKALIVKGKLEVVSADETKEYSRETQLANISVSKATDGNQPKTEYALVTTNADGEETIGEYSESQPEMKELGTYVIAYRVSQAGYEDIEGRVTLIIKEKDLSESATLGKIADKTYTGSAFTVDKELVVKDGDYTLENGTDYTLTYANNTNVGKATVTVNFIGNYTGSTSTSFSINAVPVVEDEDSTSSTESQGSSDETLSSTSDSPSDGTSAAVTPATRVATVAPAKQTATATKQTTRSTTKRSTTTGDTADDTVAEDAASDAAAQDIEEAADNTSDDGLTTIENEQVPQTAGDAESDSASSGSLSLSTWLLLAGLLLVVAGIAVYMIKKSKAK